MSTVSVHRGLRPAAYALDVCVQLLRSVMGEPSLGSGRSRAVHERLDLRRPVLRRGVFRRIEVDVNAQDDGLVRAQLGELAYPLGETGPEPSGCFHRVEP